MEDAEEMKFKVDAVTGRKKKSFQLNKTKLSSIELEEFMLERDYISEAMALDL